MYYIQKEYDMNEPKLCENCYFFRAHYAKDNNGKFHEVKDAHCTNHSIRKMTFVRARKNSYPCSDWTPVIEIDSSEDIDEIIKRAAKLIERIAAHLDIE